MATSTTSRSTPARSAGSRPTTRGRRVRRRCTPRWCPPIRPAASPNRVHAPPLSHTSCNPPVQTSCSLTVGTPDANGAAANSNGCVRLRSARSPGAPASDVRITAVDQRRPLQGGRRALHGRQHRRAATTTPGRCRSASRTRSPTRTTTRRPAGPRRRPRRRRPSTSRCRVRLPPDTSDRRRLLARHDCQHAACRARSRAGMRAIWDAEPDAGVRRRLGRSVSTAPNTLFAIQGIFVP